MKSFLTLSRRSKRITMFAALAGIALFFNACKHDNSYYYDSPSSIAAGTIVNAFPSTSSLDFYLNGNKVNNVGISYGLNSDYSRFYSGSRKATVTIAGSQTALLSKSLDILVGNYYSIFIIGKKADALDFLLLKDNTPDPGNLKSKIRFINLSPDAPALSLEVVGTTEPAFDNLSYKSYSDFKLLNSGKSTLILKDKATNLEKARLTDVDLKSNVVYTVWAKGLVAPTGTTDALSLQVTVNNGLLQ